MTPHGVALVLLPGLDGTGVLFGDLVAALRPGTRTSIVSYPPDEELGYDALESLVRSQLPADQPFVILGESFSGPIAVSITAAPPPGLRGVILCCSFLRSPRPMLGVLRPVSGFLPTRGPAVSVLARALLGKFTTPRLLEARASALDQVAPATYRHRLRCVDGVDVTTEASRVRLPALYLRATADRVVPRAASKLVSRHLQGVRVVDIDGPHMLLQGAPAAAARAIEAFLDVIVVTR